MDCIRAAFLGRGTCTSTAICAADGLGEKPVSEQFVEKQDLSSHTPALAVKSCPWGPQTRNERCCCPSACISPQTHRSSFISASFWTVEWYGTSLAPTTHTPCHQSSPAPTAMAPPPLCYKPSEWLGDRSRRLGKKAWRGDGVRRQGEETG